MACGAVWNAARALGARRLRQQIHTEDARGGPARLHKLLRAEALCLTHLAYLTAIRDLLARGGGSRGSHLVLDSEGVAAHPALGDGWRFRPENLALRQEVQEVWLGDDGEFHTRSVPVRPIPTEEYWFENTWEEYRSGRVFTEG